MIRNPNDIQEGAKKIRMLIAGYPGIGKSTLALSAPNPLHIDVDFGIDRIEPRYRKPYIQPQSYDEILGDLTPINLQDFDTLVFDTGGKLISLMSLWAIKKDPKYGQRDGSLSLKGYGFVGKEFVRLMDYCFYELQKNIVIVFHATEEKDGDNIVSEIVDIRSITGKQLCLHDSLCLLPRLCIFGIVVDHDCVFRVFGVEIIDKACKRVITQSDTAQHECCLSLRCIWHI